MRTLPAVGLITALTVVSGCSSDRDIQGAPHGVDNLVVINDDFDRWYVDGHAGATPEPRSNQLQFVGSTSNCSDEGLVGYSVEESATEVRMTVVVGESGSCSDEPVAHEGVARLDEKLGSRRVVMTQPTSN